MPWLSKRDTMRRWFPTVRLTDRCLQATGQPSRGHRGKKSRCLASTKKSEKEFHSSLFKKKKKVHRKRQIIKRVLRRESLKPDKNEKNKNSFKIKQTFQPNVNIPKTSCPIIRCNEYYEWRNKNKIQWHLGDTMVY